VAVLAEAGVGATEVNLVPVVAAARCNRFEVQTVVDRALCSHDVQEEGSKYPA